MKRQQKTLILLCGAPGSRKSTYARNNCTYDSVIISRDVIRYAFTNDGKNTYFSKEKEVFNEYVNEINICLNMYNVKYVYADATHLTQKSRNKLLNKLNLDNVRIVVINFIDDIETCLTYNNYRSGFFFVNPETIKDLRSKFEPATFFEKYKYDNIINIKDGKEV